MSVHVMSQVWRHGPKDGNDLLVLLAIADFADDEGYCWPSMASIAKKARMTERGARKIARRLEEAGHLSCDVGGGRGGSNRYRVHVINPEHETGNTVPPERQTGNVKPETRNTVTETRNGGSAEPSRTIKEPSVVKITRDEVRDILCQVATPEAVDSFLAYRRKAKGGALTATAAKRLRTGLQIIFDANHDPDDALAMAEERGWQTVKPDWYFKEVGNGNGTHGAHSAGTPRRAGSGTVDAFAAVAQRRAARLGGH